MARKSTTDRPLRPRDRVVAVADLPGVPEGTPGTVMVVDGFTWVRYWVEWDNGVWRGSIGTDRLVRADQWEDFQRRRAEEKARLVEAAAQPPGVTGTEPAAEEAAAVGVAAVGAAASGAASRVPAHLLERARAARARAAPQA